MDAKKILENITENWAVKIICVAIALFIYIFHSISALEKKSFDVPLEIRNDGIMASTAYIPSTVKVSVRTSQSAMVRLNAATSIKAFLYLTDLTLPGRFEIPVGIEVISQDTSDDPLEISVKPDSIPVVLDTKAQRYIQIEPMLYGEVDQSYKVDSVKVVPSNVKIIGPESIINSIKHIYTSRIPIKDATKSFTTPVTLDEPTTLVKAITDSPINVTVNIVTRSDTKIYEKVQLLVQNLDPALKIESAIPLITFEVAGEKDEISRYKLSDRTVYIDCKAIKEAGRYELPVRFFFPQKLMLKSSNIKKVTIEVDEKVKAPLPDAEDVAPLQEGDAGTDAATATGNENAATSNNAAATPPQTEPAQ